MADDAKPVTSEERPGVRARATVAFVLGAGAFLVYVLLAWLVLRRRLRAARAAPAWVTNLAGELGPEIPRLRILVPDEPGLLARVATEISGTGANIVEVYHQRLFSDVPAKETELDVVVETRDENHIRQLIELLSERGFATRRLSDTTREE